MNFFEAQEFIKKMNPGKEVKFDFDAKCIRFIEMVFTDGKPNDVHHVDFNQCVANIDGQDPVYIPIQSHRMDCDIGYIKGLI